MEEKEIRDVSEDDEKTEEDDDVIVEENSTGALSRKRVYSY